MGSIYYFEKYITSLEIMKYYVVYLAIDCNSLYFI